MHSVRHRRAVPRAGRRVARDRRRRVTRARPVRVRADGQRQDARVRAAGRAGAQHVRACACVCARACVSLLVLGPFVRAPPLRVFFFAGSAGARARVCSVHCLADVPGCVVCLHAAMRAGSDTSMRPHRHAHPRRRAVPRLSALVVLPTRDLASQACACACVCVCRVCACPVCLCVCRVWRV